MGMTIDDVVRYFEDMKKACCCGSEQATLAIATMRKYQKIQDIINNTDYIQEDVIRYKMICEVMKNGSN